LEQYQLGPFNPKKIKERVEISDLFLVFDSLSSLPSYQINENVLKIKNALYPKVIMFSIFLTLITILISYGCVFKIGFSLFYPVPIFLGLF